MSSVLVALFLAAGVGAFTYSKMGRRVGYGEQKSVWTLVGIAFALSFIAFLIVAKTLIPS